MKKVSVVIGTNYGDEGKGLTTDWLSSLTPSQDTLVVRFCGGANAGHTVEHDNGTRHVFSHFGSGALNKVPTLLTRDFVVNPVLFWKEYEKLPHHGGVYVDFKCQVTTPLDVMLNQEKERIRNDNRHGSTGVGLNETVTRNKKGITLEVSDLQRPEDFEQKMGKIIDYFKAEMNAINPNFDFSIIESALQRFKYDCDEFVKHLPFVDDYEILEKFEHIVFEGSQGLMLDQKSQDFPHVTRASTGITNLVEYETFINNAEINLYYITRSYLTRHGAGSMPTEKSDMYFYDQTNQPNEFQGTLRFGELDLDRMKNEVLKDAAQLSHHKNVTINTVMTWYKESDFELLKQFTKSINAKNAYGVSGKTRSSVRKIKI